MDLSEKYNGIYTEEANPYGDKPMDLVLKVTDFVQQGSVLDIGGGNGRNSLWLAEKGFAVTVQDLSAVGLELASREAEKRGVQIKTLVGSIVDLEIPDTYDVVMCLLMMHHLTQEQAYAVIDKMQSVTNPGGVNVIITWGEKGDFIEAERNANKFYPTQQELVGKYDGGWKVQETWEKTGVARQRKVSGENMVNSLVGVIWQKL